MAEKALRRDPNRVPTHPGAILREDVLPAIGEPVMAVAKKLGVTRQHLHRILAEKAPVTPDINSGVFFAARFSRSFCFFS